MVIRFEMYGVLRRLAGVEAISLESGDGLTVADALDLLARERPDLHEQLALCAVASGDTLVPRRAPVTPGTTLALLPPVAGG